MEMEVVKLSSIVRKLTPELYAFLTPAELDCPVLLRDGLGRLDEAGALEIVQRSILEHQKETWIQ